MRQAHIHEQYTAYLEGSLPDELRQTVEEHLRACPQCTSELDAMRQLVTELRTLPPAPSPVDLAAGVRAAVGAAQTAVLPASPAAGRRHPGNRRRGAAAGLPATAAPGVETCWLAGEKDRSCHGSDAARRTSSAGLEQRRQAPVSHWIAGTAEGQHTTCAHGGHSGPIRWWASSGTGTGCVCIKTNVTASGIQQTRNIENDRPYSWFLPHPCAGNLRTRGSRAPTGCRAGSGIRHVSNTRRQRFDYVRGKR